jgi:hypothetical protein
VGSGKALESQNPGQPLDLLDQLGKCGQLREGSWDDCRVKGVGRALWLHCPSQPSQNTSLRSPALGASPSPMPKSRGRDSSEPFLKGRIYASE